MKTLIKNGRVVTAVDDYKADILIEDGTVSIVGHVARYVGCQNDSGGVASLLIDKKDLCTTSRED